MNTNAQPKATTIEEPRDILKLKQALGLALEKNPTLAAFSWDIRVDEARLLQAGIMPNPELGIVTEDVLGTGDFGGIQEAQTTLQLSQIIELGNKRSARLRVASIARDLTSSTYEIKRIEVLSDVTEKFIHIIGDQYELNLAREATRLAEETLNAAQKRVQAGKASAIEEKRARVLLARSRILQEHVEHELLAARKRLSATWGNVNPIFSEAHADLYARREIPSFEQLVARIATSPEIARWATEKKLRDVEIQLAMAKRVPNVLFGGGVRRYERSDDHAFVLQLSMPLPLFDRNQGGIAEAQALRNKVDIEQNTTELCLHTVLFGLYQELKHAITELEAMQKEILPLAEEALILARRLFEQGKFSQLELLDTQRTLIEVKQENIRAAISYHQYILEIERLIGEPLTP